MINILTFDIEEYYSSGENFKDYIDDNGEFNNMESRINIEMNEIFPILEKYNAKATFFVLASLLEKNNELRMWLNKFIFHGHEIGMHSYNHNVVYNETREEFENEISHGKKLIESIISVPVIGFRAPSFSITEKSLWALDSLKKLGFLYDSSIFPIFHDRYGIPNAQRFIHRTSSNLLEIPMSTVRYFNINFPACGGGYFRLYPYKLIRHFIKKLNILNIPAIVYLHPWEFDINLPKYNIKKGINKFRQFVNIKNNKDKLERLLTDFEFISIKDYLLENNIK